MTRRFCSALGIALILACVTNTVWAHGLTGKRFFPATLTIDDPFVADELFLPSVLSVKTREGRQTTLGVELSKTITPDLGLSIGAEYNVLDPSDPDARSDSGFAPRSRRFAP